MTSFRSNSTHGVESIEYFFTVLLKPQLFRVPKNRSVSTWRITWPFPLTPSIPLINLVCLVLGWPFYMIIFDVWYRFTSGELMFTKSNFSERQWQLTCKKPSLRNMSWQIFFTRLLVSKHLPTKSSISPSIFCSSSVYFSFLWGPKYSDALLFSPGIGIFCLGCIHIGRRYYIIWLIHAFMYLVSPLFDFILFQHPGQLYSLRDNIVRILFRLEFEVTTMRGQR